MNFLNSLKLSSKRIFIGLGIAVLYFFLLLTLVEAEREAIGSNINNFSDALWYSLVTLTTVGYGDNYPVTSLGRAIGVIFVFFSIFFISLFVSNMSNAINVLRENRKYGYGGTDFKDHVVIIGWDDFAQTITGNLVANQRKVAIVTNDSDDVELIHHFFDKKLVYVVFAEFDAWEKVKYTNLEKADSILINIPGDTEKLVYILGLKKQFGGDLNFIVAIDNASLENTFEGAGVGYVLSKDDIASKMLANYVSFPEVANFSEDLLGTSKKDNDFDIKQYEVKEKNILANKKYDQAFFILKRNYNAILLGVSKLKENGKRILYKNPQEDFPIEKGDYLVVMIGKNDELKINELFKTLNRN